jgi:hypothetical protein
MFEFILMWLPYYLELILNELINFFIFINSMKRKINKFEIEFQSYISFYIWVYYRFCTILIFTVKFIKLLNSLVFLI